MGKCIQNSYPLQSDIIAITPIYDTFKYNNNYTKITTRTEGQTFDCKSIQIVPKVLVIPIVVFVNADGGVIAIGESDEREIEGIDRHIDKLNELLRFSCR